MKRILMAMFALAFPILGSFATRADRVEPSNEVSVAPPPQWPGDINGFFRVIALTEGTKDACREAVANMTLACKVNAETPANTMAEAQRLLWRNVNIAVTGSRACVEYSGFFMISRLDWAKADDGSFKSGIAVKKGTTEIYRWEERAAPGGVHTLGKPRYLFLSPAEIPQKAKIAVSAETLPEERFKAVWGLAMSGYTEDSARALADVACDKSVDETTRDYAAMGLRTFTKQLPEESRKLIQQRLRTVLGSAKGDMPDGIVQTLIAWDDAPFINETLGEQLRGHTMEIKVLGALPGEESAERLWQLYQASPKSRKSEHYDRKAEIGLALVSKNDKRGIDILINLLPADRAPGNQHRHNVFVFLVRKTNKDFGYKAQNYAPALEEAIPQMVSWWQQNRGTFMLAGSGNRQ